MKDYAEARREIEGIRGSSNQIDRVIQMLDEGLISGITAELLCNRFGTYDYMQGADRATSGDYAT